MNSWQEFEESCGEHAIISLATVFETYYKELLQQVLFKFPGFFLSQQTRYSHQIQELIEGKARNSHDQIEVKLRLKDRFSYYRFFTEYSLPLLKPQEAAFMEYIYARRNSFVHDAGKVTQRTHAKLKRVPSPVNNEYVRTESKRLRTKFKKIINAVDQRIKDSFVPMKALCGQSVLLLS